MTLYEGQAKPKDIFHQAKTCEVTEVDILTGDELSKTENKCGAYLAIGMAATARMIKHRRALEKFGHPVLR